MLRSMTGFGRALVEAPFGRFTIEIQSVNRKYFEVFVSLPKECSSFEPEVRKWVGEAISRGQVSVRVFLASSANPLLPEISWLKKVKKHWEEIARGLGNDPKEITLSFLMQHLPPKPESSAEWGPGSLEKGIAEALRGLLKMREAEGKALARDLASRLKALEQLIGKVEQLAPDATKKMRQKLLEKVEGLLGSRKEAEEAVFREIALFAERVDISEELTRFRSHILQCKGLLKGEMVGRKIDFLIQEMGREVNTIGSKSMEAKISHLVVDLKSELEKMREQIQNTE